MRPASSIMRGTIGEAGVRLQHHERRTLRHVKSSCDKLSWAPLSPLSSLLSFCGANGASGRSPTLSLNGERGRRRVPCPELRLCVT
jgi:hypothetical protein